MTLSEELTWRGFIHQTTFESITEIDKGPISFYWGVDPSANSMQIGNLAAAMMVKHFIKHGHKAYLLVGGATGMIGDPDGKKQERDLLSLEEIAVNKQAISSQYSTVFSGLDFTVVDNYDWFKNMNYLDFLREVGKHVPMRQMLGREFVSSRLGEDGNGISYAEFSYSLIQGYDFLYQYRTWGVTLQLCGADQWGNSITGVDLIRRVEGAEAHVWSTPLVVNKTTGVKFGKTEGGAIWLDPVQTSPYQFYQFLLNLDDDGIEDYLKIFTELNKEEIDSLMLQHFEQPHLRYGQKRLTEEVTRLVHGQSNLEMAQKVTKVVFGSQTENTEISPKVAEVLCQELPFVELNQDSLTDIPQILVELGLASSKSEARQFIDSGAIKVGQDGTKLDQSANLGDNVEHEIILLRRGKNSLGIVKIV